MKLFLIKFTVFLFGFLFLNSAFAKTNYPFVGTRYFSFGGVPAYHESYELSIKKNGATKLILHTCFSESCAKPRVLYRGRFKTLIGYKDEGSLRVYYVQLNKQDARLLDGKKRQQYDCDSLNLNYGPCISRYYKW